MLKTATALGGLLLLSACSSGSDPSNRAGATTVKVTLNDEGCDLSRTAAPAGAVVFAVTNGGTSKVTEAELMKGDRILGEKEDIAPGLDGSFTVQLVEGDYAFRCPGGTGPKDTSFTVTAGGTRTSAADELQQAAAGAGYADYVRAEVARQVAATTRLTDAVRAGDVAAAATAYPAARVNYEHVEPVAESFGTLDPALDARLDDVPGMARWSGYHRLEYAIFHARSLAGMRPVADRLDADVRTLQSLVATETYDATTLANGASELISEVGRSKITGEEERYAHCDFVDFQANVDGARRAFDLLTPVLRTRDPALSARIGSAFDAVDAALQHYRTGAGPTAFKPYAATAAEQHDLASVVDALAEPLSQVAARLVS